MLLLRTSAFQRPSGHPGDGLSEPHRFGRLNYQVWYSDGFLPLVRRDGPPLLDKLIKLTLCDLLFVLAAIAAQLSAGPPLLFPAIKQLLRHTEMIPEHEAFELHDALDAVQRVIRSEDLKEGTRAFSEKRAPRWSGR